MMRPRLELQKYKDQTKGIETKKGAAREFNSRLKFQNLLRLTLIETEKDQDF